MTAINFPNKKNEIKFLATYVILLYRVGRRLQTLVSVQNPSRFGAPQFPHFRLGG